MVSHMFAVLDFLSMEHSTAFFFVVSHSQIVTYAACGQHELSEFHEIPRRFVSHACLPHMSMTLSSEQGAVR